MSGRCRFGYSVLALAFLSTFLLGLVIGPPASARPAGAARQRVARLSPAPPGLQSNPEDVYWSNRFGPPGFEGLVTRVGTWQGDLIVGGSFMAYDGQPAGGVARWNGTTWQPVGSGVNTNIYGTNEIRGIQTLLGQLVVAGTFDSAGGQRAVNVATWNGSAWTSMGSLPMTNDLELFGGALWAATGDGLFRWNGGAWDKLLSGSFADLLLFNGQLIASGDFTIAANHANVAGWNGTTWTILAHQADGSVATAENFRGQLHVGGYFGTIDGTPASGMARWTGSAWQALGAGLGNWATPYDLEVFNDRLIVMGDLDITMGAPAGGVAAWDGTSWSSVGSGTNAFGTSEFTMSGLATAQELYVGGFFTVAGGQACWGLARFDGSTWSPVGPLQQAGVDSYIDDFTVWSTQLVACGDFRTAGGALISGGLAAFDGTNWSDIRAPLSNGTGRAWISRVGTYAGDLVAAGRFDHIDGNPAVNIARWNGATWQALGAGLNGEAADLTLYEGRLVAVGSFTASGAQPALYVARFDGVAWQPMGSGFNANVNQVHVHGGRLYAAGIFTQSGATPTNYIAVWNGSDWQPVGGGTNGWVHALESHGTRLVAGGAFSLAGGVSVSNVAAWDGTQWSPLGPGVPYGVKLLHSFAGRLYAGQPGSSYAASANGAASTSDVVGRLGAWDGTSWNPLGSGLTGGGGFPWGPVANAFQEFGNQLYVGGSFYNVGHKPASFIARWDAPLPSGVPETPLPIAQLSAWPNPSHGPVTFSAVLRQPDTVTLEIVDVQGRRVRRVMTSLLPAGDHRLEWDGMDDAGRSVVPGVYLARLISGTGIASARVVRMH